MAQTSAEPIAAAAAAATAAPDRAPRPDVLALERVGVGGGSFNSGCSFSPPLSRRLLRLAAFAGGDANSLTTSSFFSSLIFTAGAEPRRAGGDLRSTIFPVSARLDLETLSFATTVSFFAFTEAFAAAACLPPATTSMLPLMAIAASASPSSSQLTPIFASAARTSSSPTSPLPARGTSPFTCCRSRGNSTG